MPEQETPPEELRIGVYTCHCGGNISDVVNCERVAQELEQLPHVIVSRRHLSMCSDAGQSMIEQDIREQGLNRVVIGACAPSLHEKTFRRTVARAGLNPYLYYHVGIREQDSWVHSHNREAATEKAIRLIATGVAKARHLEPLDPIHLPAAQHALVIGGGVAGLRAAWDIARCGLYVSLIEKNPFLGGHMAQLETIFPTGENARALLHELIDKVVAHPLITIYTQAELAGVKGSVGDYQVHIVQQSRGIVDHYKGADEAMARCPVTVPDEFNNGLTERKAIYRPYANCYPPTPAIDWQNCTGCGECLHGNGQGIDLQNKPQAFDLTVGAVVVATGFRPYEPRQGEYGYGDLPEVITLAQLNRLLALHEGAELTWQDHPVRRIALIHCVGSRQIDGVHEPQADGQVNNYCSRICCAASLHAANELRQRFPQVHVYDLHEDIRTYGRGHEALYTEASERMVRFLRFRGDDLPQVRPAETGESYPVIVQMNDRLTWGQAVEIPVDLVVLATGVEPNPITEIVRMLKVSPGADRFLAEVHPKLRPVETAVPGIILAGTAQGPMNIQESCAAASAAAAKVAVLLGQGQVELEPFVAKVNLERCTGSGECVTVCGYEDAIALETVLVNGRSVQRAVINPANCTGCGACVSACPNRALDVQGWTLDQYEAMVDVIAADSLADLLEVTV